MIKCHLSRLMGEKKVRISDVARETGLHRGIVTLLYEETAQRIDVNAMNALCKYFDCKIEELFEYVDDEA